jgi:hypothetical protein
MATIFIGSKRYSIPSFYLQKYPLLEDRSFFEDLRLPGVPEDIGHTLVHFLSTGVYETIDSPLGEHLSYVEREYQRSVQVYHTSRKYGLPDLEALAEKYIEYFGKALTTVELVNSTQEAFALLPEDEVWLPKYVKKVLLREFVTEKSPPNIREITNNGTGKKSEFFRTAVMAAVIDILYIQVQRCMKTHEGHLDSLGVEGDTEPEHVAASDTGTGEYVVWPEGPASAKTDAAANGLPITPDENAVDDHRSFFPPAPICDHDDLKGFHSFGYLPLPCYEKPAPEIPALEEPTPEEDVPEPPPEDPVYDGVVYEEAVYEEAAADEIVPDEPVPKKEIVPEEAIAQQPAAEVIIDQATSDSPLVPNSSLYANWKDLSPKKQKLRTKKLRARGLPIPNENGIISITLA